MFQDNNGERLDGWRDVRRDVLTSTWNQFAKPLRDEEAKWAMYQALQRLNASMSSRLEEVKSEVASWEERFSKLEQAHAYCKKQRDKFGAVEPIGIAPEGVPPGDGYSFRDLESDFSLFEDDTWADALEEVEYDLSSVRSSLRALRLTAEAIGFRKAVLDNVVFQFEAFGRPHLLTAESADAILEESGPPPNPTSAETLHLLPLEKLILALDWVSTPWQKGRGEQKAFRDKKLRPWMEKNNYEPPTRTALIGQYEAITGLFGDVPRKSSGTEWMSYFREYRGALSKAILDGGWDRLACRHSYPSCDECREWAKKRLSSKKKQ
jgi:hypothetical protein